MTSNAFESEQCDAFKAQMWKVISEKLGKKEFEDTANDTAYIVNSAMDKLEEMDVKGFKYAVDFLVMPEDSGYRRNTSFWWAQDTDKCMKVNVKCDKVRGYLVAYAMREKCVC